MKPDTTPRKIHLETPNYFMRTIEFTDASDEWGSWFADPVTVQMLNKPPRTMKITELQGHIAWFDRINRHLLGIFDKATQRLVGIREAHIDWAKKDFLINVLIGDPNARRHGARAQTSDVLYRFFFEELDLRSAHCTTVSENGEILRVLQRNGWTRQKSEFRANANGGAPLELIHFRLWRGKWRERRAKDGDAQ